MWGCGGYAHGQPSPQQLVAIPSGSWTHSRFHEGGRQQQTLKRGRCAGDRGNATLGVGQYTIEGTRRLTGTAAAGVNGAGKTTQLQIISGALEPDAGTISREKPDMKVAYLTQEFDVTPTHTVRVRLCGVHMVEGESVAQEPHPLKGLGPAPQHASCCWRESITSALSFLPASLDTLSDSLRATTPASHHGLRPRSALPAGSHPGLEAQQA